MLTVNMYNNFLLKVKTLDRTDIASTGSHDVLFYLNQAQDILIDKLVQERKFEYLRPLTLSQTVAHAAFVTTTGTYVTGISGAAAIDLSALTTFRNYLHSQSVLTRTAAPAATSVSVMNKAIEKEEIFRYETNGTNKPIFTNPKEIVEGKYLIVLPDAYTTLASITAIYVKTPTALILTTPASDTSDLPPFLHQDIVDIAVKLSQETVNINDIKKN